MKAMVQGNIIIATILALLKDMPGVKSALAAPTPPPNEVTGVQAWLNWIINTIKTHGLMKVLIIVGVVLVAVILVFLFKATLGGIFDAIKEKVKVRAKQGIEKTIQVHQQDQRLREYLLHSISEAYCHLDLKSLDESGICHADVRLREVYIPLRARGRIPSEERKQQGRESIIAAERVEDKPPELTEWLARWHQLVVMGRAGSGKSTFLRYAAAVLADAWCQEDSGLVRKLLKTTLDPLPVPVHFSLREFSVYWQALKPEEKTVALQSQALLKFLEHNFSHYGLDAGFFRERLRQGGCLILLDGLDEVKQEVRPALVEVVEAFVRDFSSQDRTRPNRYVLTCRPEAYRGRATLRQFQEVTIDPLGSEQVADFIARWYREVMRRDGVLTSEGEREAEEKTRTLLNAIKDKPQVRDLTDTPLLLTLVAMLHHRAQLPESRVELYHDCTRLLLDKWERSRPGEEGRKAHQDLTPQEVPATLDERRRLLQPAAFWLLQAGLAEAPKSAWAKQIAERRQLPGKPEEVQRRLEVFLDWSKERCNILEEGADGQYRFTHHRTFQEYLAAGYLVSLETEGIKTSLGLISNRDWWETLRLMVAATPDSVRRGEFLRGALASQKEEGALLAASCLAEVRDPYLDPALTRETQERLLGIMVDHTLSVKDSRALAGQLLGRRGDPRLDVEVDVPVVMPVLAGTFSMGSSEDNKQAFPDERPPHEVSLSAFWIGRYPVTNAQYDRFVKAEGYETDRFWTSDGWGWRQGKYKPDLSSIKDKDFRESFRRWIEGRTVAERERSSFWKDSRWNIRNHPVVGVTWFEAMAYCSWLEEELQKTHSTAIVWQNGRPMPLSLEGKSLEVRLPTEAEWEASARGQAGNEWPWGATFDAKLANTSESEIDQTTAVGLYPAGASPCGTLDMAGNVWEWCQSLYKPYPYRADDGREDLEVHGVRVLRGGSWYDDAGFARCACRYGFVPDAFIDFIGFRVVLSPQ